MQSASDVPVELIEHAALVEQALTELRPNAVAPVETGARMEAWLANRAAKLGFAQVEDPGSADLVISGAGNYASVRRLLDDLRGRSAAALIGGTSWPCGRRDTLLGLELLGQLDRRRFAFRAPVPGQRMLGPDPAPVAFALEDGGPENGVLTAIEDACREAPSAWEVRLVLGFGGFALLLPLALATAERWDAIIPDDLIERTMARLEVANVQLRIDRVRLQRERDAALSDRRALPAGPEAEHRGKLEQRFAAVVAEADERMERERLRISALEHGLAAEQAALRDAQAALRDAQATIERLERQVSELSAALEQDTRAHEEERAYVIRQARLIAGSQAWRWGHRVVTFGRRLTFRRTRGTDAVQRLLERVAGSADVPPAADAAPEDP